MALVSEYDYVLSIPDKLGAHVGKWIIVFENKIIDNDEDLTKTYTKFQKEHPNKIPFIMKIPKEKDMLL